ncbi:outer membrane lipoprotein carrier protein LolA [Flavobacterium sp. NST-5]|uniref:Outer membrane lipoprotein carrier protein LolA n=2 Tax=Flavobacterium ichthyis TaxID=2698827 RepID=A0ABW9ZAP4_9FLAO|nr:outer membrane lipoprotein carrier protein LolA [Flavobacterium ichthyis]
MNKSIKMNKILLFISVFFITFNLSAQNSQKAKNLLDEVSSKVKSYQNISIEFKYAISNPKENLNRESKGNVVIQGNKYVLNFMGVTKMYDGKKVYNIVPEDEEITISKSDENDENSITPSKMLTFFNTGYKYSWDILQNIKGRKIQYVKLVPTSAKDDRKEVFLGIDIQTKHIYNMMEIGKDGSKITTTVNSFKTNQPLSKNQFTFAESKYPNYYINNLD